MNSPPVTVMVVRVRDYTPPGVTYEQAPWHDPHLISQTRETRYGEAEIAYTFNLFPLDAPKPQLPEVTRAGPNRSNAPPAAKTTPPTPPGG